MGIQEGLEVENHEGVLGLVELGLPPLKLVDEGPADQGGAEQLRMLDVLIVLQMRVVLPHFCEVRLLQL